MATMVTRLGGTVNGEAMRCRWCMCQLAAGQVRNCALAPVGGRCEEETPGEAMTRNMWESLRQRGMNPGHGRKRR